MFISGLSSEADLVVYRSQQGEHVPEKCLYYIFEPRELFEIRASERRPGSEDS
jgi:hypothetical protein